MDLFYVAQHQRCTAQICKELYLQRPDDEKRYETLNSEKFAYGATQDISIICDMC